MDNRFHEKIRQQKWDILIEEPEKKYLKHLVPLWKSKHVDDIRDLDISNLHRVDIRFHDLFTTLPPFNKIETLIRHIPSRISLLLRQFYDYLELNEKILKRRKPNDKNIARLHSLSYWYHIVPKLDYDEAFSIFVDSVFECHTLSKIMSSHNNILLHAGSWHCRNINDFLRYQSTLTLQEEYVFPLSHPLEKNCVAIDY